MELSFNRLVISPIRFGTRLYKFGNLIEKKLLISRRKYLLAPVVAQVSKLVPNAVLIRTSLKVEKGRLEGGKQERLTILRAMLEAKLDKEIILRAGFTEEEIEKLSPEGEH